MLPSPIGGVVPVKRRQRSAVQRSHGKEQQRSALLKQRILPVSVRVYVGFFLRSRRNLSVSLSSSQPAARRRPKCT